MMERIHHPELVYFEGEKPKPLKISFYDENKNLDTSLAGATLVAKFSIDGVAQTDVPMTNNVGAVQGKATIDWPTASNGPFAVKVEMPPKKESTGTIDIQATEGSNVWFPYSFTFPIRKRA